MPGGGALVRIRKFLFQDDVDESVEPAFFTGQFTTERLLKLLLKVFEGRKIRSCLLEHDLSVSQLPCMIVTEA